MEFLKYLKPTKDGVKLSAVDVWSRRFLDLYNKNHSVRGVSRDLNFYSNGYATYSGRSNVTYYYTFDNLPNELPVAFVDEFRAVAREGVKVNFIYYLEPTKIDWNSPALINKLKVWKGSSEDVDGVDEFNFRENVKLLDLDVIRRKSLVYLSSAEIRRGRRTFKTKILMIVAGTRGTDFDDTVEDCEAVAHNLGISCNRVTDSMSTILRAFSPMSSEMTDRANKLVGSVTLTDELIARFNTYDQGRIGEKGIYIGTDIYSGFPVLKQIKRTPESAENILITATTGWGKSTEVKLWISQLSADDRFTGTIMDIEGFEYIPYRDFLGTEEVLVLNMSQGQGQYFDPVPIIRVGNDEIDKEMFNNSIRFTKSILRVLIEGSGDEELSSTWVSFIISDSVARTYKNAGVSEDPSSWDKSESLSLKKVYLTFKELYKDSVNYKYEVESGQRKPDAENNYKLNPEYIKTLDTAASSLKTYFEDFDKGGINSDIFKNKISLNDLIMYRIVICSFGLAGKSEADIDLVQLSLSQSYAAIISQIRSMYSKARGKYNFKVWEELQRWGRMKGSEAILNSALTGGRKNGDVNIIVTNKISELLGDNDKFGVFENTNTFAIGSITNAHVRAKLCEALSIEDLKFELDKLFVKRKKSSKDNVSTFQSIYDKAFLVKLDTGDLSLVRAELPEDIAESDIFRTGVSLVEESR